MLERNKEWDQETQLGPVAAELKAQVNWVTALNDKDNMQRAGV